MKRAACLFALFGLFAAPAHAASFTGVWLTLWLRRYSTLEERRAVYGELVGYIAEGRMRAEIEATYPLDRIKDAVAHAMQGGRGGKVVITPNA